MTSEQVPNIKFWKQGPNITSFECQNAILFFVIRFSLFVFHFSTFGLRPTFKFLMTFEQLPNIISQVLKAGYEYNKFRMQNAFLLFVIRFSLFVFHCSFFDIRTQADYQVLNVKNLVGQGAEYQVRKAEPPFITSFECQNGILFFVIRFFVIRHSDSGRLSSS